VEQTGGGIQRDRRQREHRGPDRAGRIAQREGALKQNEGARQGQREAEHVGGGVEAFAGMDAQLPRRRHTNRLS
jgi:hypothetical protein